MIMLGTPELDAYQALVDEYDDVPKADEPAHIEDMMESRLAAEVEAERNVRFFRMYREGGVSEADAAHITDYGLCARWLARRLGRPPTDREVMQRMAMI